MGGLGDTGRLARAQAGLAEGEEANARMSEGRWAVGTSLGGAGDGDGDGMCLCARVSWCTRDFMCVCVCVICIDVDVCVCVRCMSCRISVSEQCLARLHSHQHPPTHSCDCCNCCNCRDRCLPLRHPFRGVSIIISPPPISLPSSHLPTPQPLSLTHKRTCRGSVSRHALLVQVGPHLTTLHPCARALRGRRLHPHSPHSQHMLALSEHGEPL